MSFNRRILPQLEDLKEMRNSCNNDIEFIKRIVGKSDVIMGPSDSMAFISEIRKNLNEKKEDAGSGPRKHQ